MHVAAKYALSSDGSLPNVNADADHRVDHTEPSTLVCVPPAATLNVDRATESVVQHVSQHAYKFNPTAQTNMYTASYLTSGTAFEYKYKPHNPYAVTC